VAAIALDVVAVEGGGALVNGAALGAHQEQVRRFLRFSRTTGHTHIAEMSPLCIAVK
jgi:hypothetical protein